MAKNDYEEPIDPKFRALYPDKSDEWLREAQDNLERYIEVVAEIYERIQDDPEAYARFKEELKKTRRRS